MRELNEDEALSVKQVDLGCKCSWNWNWLKLEISTTIETKTHIFPLSHCIKKIDKNGHGRCTLCMREFNYSNRGSQALVAHCQTECHVRKLRDIITTRSVAPVLAEERPAPAQGPEKIREQILTPVPTSDRIANAEVGKVVKEA